jgi:hypothetical protein
MVFGVEQPQRKNWVKQLKKKWSTRARRPLKDTSLLKIFVLELDSSNWELDTSL